MTDDFFKTALLDDDGKHQLCLDLLTEFSAQNVRGANSRGEIIHSCCLPFGQHRNGDRRPSASLNYKKLTYNCLGCGSSGGLLWFIAVCRGEDGNQVRQWLAEQTGLDGQVMDWTKLLAVVDEMYEKAAAGPPPVPSFAEAVLDPWDLIHPYMTDGAPEFGITGRHVPEETLEHFRVGYAESYHMGPYEPPQERIIIPHFWKDKLVGWQARRIDDSQEPKYKNSPEFPKDRTLYNYRPGVDAVLVESPLSVLRHWHHQPHLMATFGAEMPDAQLKLLQRMKTLTVWFDNDNGGWKGTEHIIEALSRHVTVKVVDNPYDADVADLDDATVDKLITTAIPWGLWSRPTSLLEVP